MKPIEPMKLSAEQAHQILSLLKKAQQSLQEVPLMFEKWVPEDQLANLPGNDPYSSALIALDCIEDALRGMYPKEGFLA